LDLFRRGDRDPRGVGDSTTAIIKASDVPVGTQAAIAADRRESPSPLVYHHRPSADCLTPRDRVGFIRPF
jgi:hypothetical protein